MAMASTSAESGNVEEPTGEDEIDKEITIRYLQGEISFEEYSDILESRFKIEPEDDTLSMASVEVTTDALESVSISSEKADRKPRVKSKVRKSKLPRHLQGLMGEANMKFARGEIEETIKMCMEVIRLVPIAPEPFQTLGLVYEEQGDAEKALQYHLIAAHLSRGDSEEWERLAELSMERGNVKQAVMCYDKAIRFNGRKESLVWARCDLHEQLGDKKKAVEGYQIILSLYPADAGDKYLQLARDVTKTQHALGEKRAALDTIERAFELHKDHVTAEDVNMFLELHIAHAQYAQSLEVLHNHCGVLIQLSPTVAGAGNAMTSHGDASTSDGCAVGDDSSWLRRPDLHEVVEAVAVPSELAIDLRVKLAICLVHLKCTSVVTVLLAPLFEMVTDDVGDLYLDLAEAFTETGDFRSAEPLLHRLVQSTNYNLAAVWLRYAECLQCMSEMTRAAAAYERVVAMAPSHTAARVSLAALQQQLGRHEAALSTLAPEVDQSLAEVDARIALPRCLLLLSRGAPWRAEFIASSKRLIFHQLADVMTSHHLDVILGKKTQKRRFSALREALGATIEGHIIGAGRCLQNSVYQAEDLWDLYIKLCDELVEGGRMQEFLEVSILALVHPLFLTDAVRVADAEFVCFCACVLARCSEHAYSFIREICLTHLDNTRAWNLFSQIVSQSNDCRHNRFCLRLMLKHPSHLALGLLNGHNALVAGTYKHALGEYVAAFRQTPRCPLVSLCVGLTFIHMASQKFCSKRHSLVVQACSFLNQYMELRGECQETYYNMGRAMHQIGLSHVAVHYYQKALEIPPSIPDNPEVFDLSREIAYNLCLIYKNSGSHQLAAHIMNQHIVI